MRAVTYHRLSQHTEESTSIARQREETRARCEREGWTIVEELVDPSVSGAKAREKARRALRMLRQGEADVLVVAALDRWSRMGIVALAELIEVLDEREASGSPALFVMIREGQTSAIPGWRITTAVIAEVARQERELIRSRVTASHAKLAAEGRWRGGTVPWCYLPEKLPTGGYRLVVNEEQALHARAAAQRMLDGASAWSVVRDFNRDRVPTTLRKGEWTVSRFVSIMTSPRMVGQVIYHGDVVRDDDGLPVTAWEPALPPEIWERLRVLLNADRNPRPPRRHATRVLSGLMRCSGCGKRLRVTSIHGKPYYACDARQRASASCSGPVAAPAEKIEELVAERYLSAYGEREVFERIEVAPEDVGLAEVTRAIAATSAELAKAATEDVFKRLQALQKRRDDLMASPRLRRVELRPTGRLHGQAWADGDVEERRALLEAVYPFIRLMPASRTGRNAPVADRLAFPRFGPGVHHLGEDHPDRYTAGQLVLALSEEADDHQDREDAAIAAGGAVLDAYDAALGGEDSDRVRALGAAWASGPEAWATYVAKTNEAPVA